MDLLVHVPLCASRILYFHNDGSDMGVAGLIILYFLFKMETSNSYGSVGVAENIYRNAKSFPVILLVMTAFWLLIMLGIMNMYNPGFHALTTGTSTLMILGGKSNGLVQKLVS